MKKGVHTVARRKKGEDRAGLLSELVNVEEGLVSPHVFVDPEIHRLELERVFARSWLYVAHESEIPGAGDFVTRVMGEDPVVVWRGQDGEIRVFLNVCRHRGRRVCGEEMGKAANFQCPYHGWTYGNRGELISVPFFKHYHGRLDKGSLGLYQAPQVDSYHGLIFANWEEGSESLSDYLGEVKWVLDLLFGRTDGIEVKGPPMRWVVDGNWKLGAGNFAGDTAHLSTTHGFSAALSAEDKQRGQRLSYKLTTEKGHAVSLVGFAGEFNLGLPENLWPEMECHLSREQLHMIKPLLTVVGNVFPNMSLLDSGIRETAQPTPFKSLRLWQPKVAQTMEVWSWFFVDKNAPGSWKEASPGGLPPNLWNGRGLRARRYGELGGDNARAEGAHR